MAEDPSRVVLRHADVLEPLRDSVSKTVKVELLAGTGNADAVAPLGEALPDRRAELPLGLTDRQIRKQPLGTTRQRRMILQRAEPFQFAMNWHLALASV